MKSKEKQILAEQKFRPLKKNLQKTFKKIRQCIQFNDWPDKATMEQFQIEIEIMVSYPGFGDEYYDNFLANCRELVHLFSKGDIKVFQKQYEKIAALRKDCHNRYRYSDKL